ncbi:hypothetical protein ANCCEY_09527 [Ancylostoma ceylanicum]|uniref:POLQ-like helical domain-containing protein n=1 Tax=Ancylostoma ceylanicum TaxID=53326 RepID=A0A0D6LHE2_9BILA|nr:hypothetical protein ANCCEY_09527 [Ancylostoma ceylanicum]
MFGSRREHTCHEEKRPTGGASPDSVRSMQLNASKRSHKAHARGERLASAVQHLIVLAFQCICDGLATSAREVEEIAQSTLFKPLKSAEDILCDLVKNRFLTVDEDTTRSQNAFLIYETPATKLSPTQLGRATLVSALPPDAALFVFADLQQATKSIVLDTELHMLYLVRLLLQIAQFGKDATGTICTVGANDRFILSRLRGSSAASSDRSYQLHLRFFSALALFDVVNEKPVDEVARRFRISRGTLQTLQQQSATYAAMVVAFCSRLGWTYLHDLLKGFAARLAFGVRRELTELVSINGLDASRARIFHDHEITSFAQLSNCTTKKVAEILSLAVPFNRCRGAVVIGSIDAANRASVCLIVDERDSRI